MTAPPQGGEPRKICEYITYPQIFYVCCSLFYAAAVFFSFMIW